jgi:hypothetical protein
VIIKRQTKQKNKNKGMPRTTTHISKRVTQDGVTVYMRENKIASKFTENTMLLLTTFF